MEYRREIDGLRALAVLPVILFHANFQPFSGGYVGVDIFFVISGYLITSLILSERAAGKFSLLDFYERRARRILPALFVVMAVCIPLAWVWMLPHQLKDFSQSLVAASMFLSNVFFFLEADYFNNFSQTAPLLHTWSLAVEEQYYLLFPLLLIAIWKLGRKWAPIALLLLSVPSLLAAQWASVNAPAANFYLLPTRGWELLAGALLAFYTFRRKATQTATTSSDVNQAVPQVLSLTGLLLILYAVVALNKHTPFPSLYTLIPTAGAMLIILFAGPQTHVGKLLSSRILVGMGLISYSAYLWHQPLFAFARILTHENTSALLYLTLCLLVLPLSYLSWALIERPARTTRIRKRLLFSGVVLFAGIFLTFGYVGHHTDGFMEYKLNQLDPEYRAYAINKNVELDKRLALWSRASATASRPFPQDSDKKRILILGDSKSEDLYMAIKLNEPLFSGSVFRRARLDDECIGAFLGKIDQSGGSLANEVCRNEIGELLATELLESADEIVLTANWQAHTHPYAADLVAALSKPGKEVSVVSTANFHDLTSLSMAIARNKLSERDINRYLFNNIHQEWLSHSLALKARLMKLGKGRFLEKLDILCNRKQGLCDLFSASKKPYIYDTGHLTVYGARQFGRKIYDRGWFQ